MIFELTFVSYIIGNKESSKVFACIELHSSFFLLI